jgi:hypothetical protein
MSDEILLPGGLWIDERVERVATLRPVTGHVERACSRASAASRPERVTKQLTAAVERMGDVCMTEQVATDLAVGDRRYLMLQIGRRLCGDKIWLSPRCPACSELFDVGVQRSELPLAVAHNGFPFTSLEVEGYRVVARVATGRDQQELLAMGKAATERSLLQLCLVAVDGEPPQKGFVDSLAQQSVERIDAALEEIAPDVGTRLQTSCPSCGQKQVVEIDPCEIGPALYASLDEEVHTIAIAYHWSEQDILSLEREQRQRYLSLISREHGVHG